MAGSKLAWRDVSSFSREEKDRTPESFSLELNHCEIGVHRHIYYPGAWLAHCWELNVKDKVLKSVEIEQAKKEAIKLCCEMAEDIYTELKRLT